MAQAAVGPIAWPGHPWAVRTALTPLEVNALGPPKQAIALDDFVVNLLLGGNINTRLARYRIEAHFNLNAPPVFPNNLTWGMPGFTAQLAAIMRDLIVRAAVTATAAHHPLNLAWVQPMRMTLTVTLDNAAGGIFYRSFAITLQGNAADPNNVLAQLLPMGPAVGQGLQDTVDSDPSLQNYHVVAIAITSLHLPAVALPAGCSECRAMRWETSHDGKCHYQIVGYQVDNMNCGLACFNAEARLRGGENNALKYDALRAQMGVADGVPLHDTDLQRASDIYKINFVVYTRADAEPCFAYTPHVGPTLQLLRDLGHYSTILEIASTCDCGRRNNRGHRCRFTTQWCEKCQCHFERQHLCPYSGERAEDLARRDAMNARLAQREAQRAKEVAENIKNAVVGAPNEEELRALYEIVFRDQRHCLLIGPGGTGKTMIGLQRASEMARELGEPYVVLCPTGQSTTHLEDARTLHSAFKIVPGVNNAPDALIKRMSTEEKEAWRALTYMFLDEFSMIDDYHISLVDATLKMVRGSQQPFGGVLGIFVGDPLQLTPVDGTTFFWESDAIRGLIDRDECGLIYLTDPVRYPDASWFETLQRCRIGKPTQEDCNKLSARVKTLEQWTSEKQWDAATMPVLACCRNRDAKEINDKRVKERAGQLHTFERAWTPRTQAALDAASATNATARLKIQREATRRADKLCEAKLELFVGAKVMLLVNQSASHKYLYDHGVGNGTVGLVAEISETEVLVDFSDARGEECCVGVQCHTYENLCKQFPLRLAYACTIHKLQGTSLDKMVLDLRGCFCDHQAYVALSRVKRFSCLYLVGGTAVHAQSLRRCLGMINPRCLAMADAESKKPLPAPAIDDLGQMCHDWDVAPQLRMRVPKHLARHKNYRTKSIFFDLESRHAHGQIVAYHMQALRTTSDTMQELSWTKSERGDDVMRGFCKFIVDQVLEDVRRWESKRNATESAEKQWARRPWTLCAYNGGNFDFHFFIQYLFNESQLKGVMNIEYKVSQMWRAKTLAYFDLRHRPTGKVCLVLHDLCRFLMCPLNKASKDLLGTNEKGVFPHQHVSRCGWRSVLDTAQPRVIERADFFDKDLPAVDALARMTADEREDALSNCLDIACDEEGRVQRLELDLAMQLNEYARADVRVLFRLYAKIDALVRDTLHNASVLDFFSSNQLSRYGVLRDLPVCARMPFGKSDREIVSFLFTLEPDMDAVVSDAMYGGRTFPRQTAFRSRDLSDTRVKSMVETHANSFQEAMCAQYEVIDALCMVDIMSMYVSIMKDMEFPYGPAAFLSPRRVAALNDFLRAPADSPFTPEPVVFALLTHQFCGLTFAVLDVTVSGSPADVEPPVPYRDEDKRIVWDSCYRRQRMTHIDLGLMLRAGGKCHAVHGGVCWPRHAKLFENYMQQTLAWKNNGEATQNEALRAFGKLLGNTVYGGMAMKTHYGSVAMCTTDDDLQQFFAQNDWEGLHAYPHGMMVWGKKKHDSVVHSPTPKQIGAFVLAYSRKMVDDFINAVNPWRMRLIRASEDNHLSAPMRALILKQATRNQPRTGDTDSLIIHADQVPLALHAGFLGPSVGQWTCDLHKDFWHRDTPVMGLILEYNGPAPKSYAITYMLPSVQTYTDGTVRVVWDHDVCREKVRMKGINQNSPVKFEGQTYRKLDASLFRRIVNTIPDAVELDSCDELLDYEDEHTQSEHDIAHQCMESIYRVGYKSTAREMERGNRPMTLQPARITRSMFANGLYTGRQVWEVCVCPGAVNTATGNVQNAILVPKSFTGTNQFPEDSESEMDTAP